MLDNSQATPESDEYTEMNLAMLVRRLAHQLKKLQPENKLSEQAVMFLETKKLNGSLLREAIQHDARI